MVRKSIKSKGKLNKAAKQTSHTRKPLRVPHGSKTPSKVSRVSAVPTLQVPIHSPQLISLSGRPVFSIEIGSISGETTIGDLIVAFPRTRDVLMKHGFRFDVEEAGFLYMTLNVFSAIHGLTTNNLVQELHTASREPPAQPAHQQLRPMTTTSPA